MRGEKKLEDGGRNKNKEKSPTGADRKQTDIRIWLNEDNLRNENDQKKFKEQKIQTHVKEKDEAMIIDLTEESTSLEEKEEIEIIDLTEEITAS